jgi:hypothetical protein
MTFIVLMAGHNVKIKPPQTIYCLFWQNTSLLSRLAIKLLLSKELENFDAVIATGSNNTARYFEYYFKTNHLLMEK